jgi:hypothetical protein
MALKGDQPFGWSSAWGFKSGYNGTNCYELVNGMAFVRQCASISPSRICSQLNLTQSKQVCNLKNRKVDIE